MYCIVGLFAESCVFAMNSTFLSNVGIFKDTMKTELNVPILRVGRGTLRHCLFLHSWHFTPLPLSLPRPSLISLLCYFMRNSVASRLCVGFYLINDWHLRVHRPQMISPTCCVTAVGSLPVGGRATLVCIHLLKVCIHHTVSITQSRTPCSKCRVQGWIEG